MSGVQAKSTGRRDQMKEQIQNLGAENAKKDERIQALEVELAEANDRVQGLETQLSDGKVAFDAFKEQHEAAIDAQSEEVQILTAQRDSAIAQVEAMEAELAELAETLSVAQARLEDPAFTAAGKTAAKEAVQTAADAEADELEAKATAETSAQDPVNELETYEAMEAGDERSAYFAKNKRLILKQLAQREQDQDGDEG